MYYPRKLVFHTSDFDVFCNKKKTITATLAKCVTELFRATEGTVCNCSAAAFEMNEGY